MKFNTSAHSVYNLKAHVIFVVAYQRKAITQKILVRLEEIFHEVCSHYNTHLIEFSGEADHVHLLIEYSPVVRLADLIRVLKSVSSQKIRAEYYSEIKHLLWGQRFWTRSYCVISVGDGANTEIVERYIRNQNQPK